MKIVRARQISQLFFFLLFLWFCVVATLGESWWQLRGWPVNWLLQLDPLVALATVLTTRTLYAGLAWALATIVLTLVLGRFFCGWVCPFGALHHFVGFLGGRNRALKERVARNSYHPAQVVKYFLLSLLLGAAAGDWLAHPPWVEPGLPGIVWGGFLVGLLVLLYLSAQSALTKKAASKDRGLWGAAAFAGAWVLLGALFSGHSLIGASLQTGLLDPIPLIHRSINLVVLPILDGGVNKISAAQRYSAGAWLIGALFLAAVLMNLVRPRFYCRFVCPLGALFGILDRNSLWRVGKNRSKCLHCELCDSKCEGACSPSEKLRWSECLLCMNCMDACQSNLMTYQTLPSAGGEQAAPDLSRRAVLIGVFSGVAAVPMMRLGGMLANNWSPAVIRPPGALAEYEFLKRCLKCGQCMRVCPTNVIQPAAFEAGAEGLWTPVLNFRAGTSGCQYNCVACGHICPTVAIRPLTLDEKHGTGSFSASGPVRSGVAFVDRGRCLPWAMDKPCLVCQENCPVSPKAIFTREIYTTIRNGRQRIKAAEGMKIELEEGALKPGGVSTGDYFLHLEGESGDIRRQILQNGESSLVLSPEPSWQRVPEAGGSVEILIRLKQPHVDPERCLGCGICEHECPVSGLRAIRVSAENESRNRKRRLLL